MFNNDCSCIDLVLAALRPLQNANELKIIYSTYSHTQSIMFCKSVSVTTNIANCDAAIDSCIINVFILVDSWRMRQHNADTILTWSCTVSCHARFSSCTLCQNYLPYSYIFCFFIIIYSIFWFSGLLIAFIACSSSWIVNKLFNIVNKEKWFQYTAECAEEWGLAFTEK